MLSRLAPKILRQRSRIRNQSSKQHRTHIVGQLETLESRHLLALVVSNLPAEEIAADSATIGASIAANNSDLCKSICSHLVGSSEPIWAHHLRYLSPKIQNSVFCQFNDMF